MMHGRKEEEEKHKDRIISILYLSLLSDQ